MERGLAYAEACFETFRVIDGACFEWHRHLHRLSIGLASYGIELSGSDGAALQERVFREAAEVGSDTLVRITVCGGNSAWGLTSSSDELTAYIQIHPFTPSTDGIDLNLHEWPFPLREKQAKFTSDYAETLRALKGLRDTHVIFEQKGFLIAAATANILLFRSGQWWTPSATAGVLPGVIRSHLIDRSVVRECDCPVNWLRESEALALCNSGFIISRVAAITDINVFDIDHPAYRTLTNALAGEAGMPKDLR